MNAKRLTWFGLVAMGILLVGGFYGVLEKRFVEGDIYPHYASYLSEPLGTSALYETLERHPGFTVERNITHLNSVKGLTEDTALLLLGLPRESIETMRAPQDSPVIKAVAEGARLVITVNPELVPEKFQPSQSEQEKDWLERRRELREKQLRERSELSDPPAESDPPEKEAEKEAENEDNGKDEEESSSSEDAEGKGEGEEDEKETFEEMMTRVIGPKLTNRLEFELAGVKPFERPEGGWELKPGRGARDFEPPLPLPNWYSQFRFEKPDRKWRVIARIGKEPVVIERDFGVGTIVLATDSFFVSNEALHLGAVPEFLLWMTGGKSRIIFDETIHGSVETGGAMKLIRQYRLQGILIGLLIVIGLWAWRSASALAPGSGEVDQGLIDGHNSVAGEEIGSGLIRLLKKSVPRSSLIQKCIEIRKSGRGLGIQEEQIKKIEEIRRNHQGNPGRFGVVSAYEQITEVLRKL
ncbi:MAG: DUF4350 domain-containing protein [Verrucomicrobiota bacterium]